MSKGIRCVSLNEHSEIVFPKSVDKFEVLFYVNTPHGRW